MKGGKEMRARVAILLMVVLAVGSFAAQPGTFAQGTKVEGVAIAVPASRTDRGWNQAGVDSLEKVARARGFKVEVAENLGYGDIKAVLRDMARRNQLLICHASGYQTICPEVAREVNARVAIIDNVGAVTPGLISSIVAKAQEGAYLAGVLAGQVTQTNTIGIVASGTPPTWNRMAVGFAEGLKATNPDVRLFYSLIGHPAYEDAAGARRVTEAQLGVGADIIFGMGNGSSFGIIRAIAERNARRPSPKAWLIDVIGDKRDLDRDRLLLTSVYFDFSVVYEQMVADIERGTFGKVYTLDSGNKGVTLLPLAAGVPTRYLRAVERARTEIAAGRLRVSDIPGAPEMMARLRELFPRTIR
jgi:simple sugar transport system substrate-binding protein